MDLLTIVVRLVLFFVIAGFIIGTIALLATKDGGRHRD